jgi:hypothetical protein
MIFCSSGSDFGKVSVPVQVSVQENIEHDFSKNKIVKTLLDKSAQA